MKVLVLVLVACIGVSCITQKRCLNKFPPDTIRTETVTYRDTIIPIYIPAFDTIYVQSTILDTLIINSGTVHSQTWVVRDTIRQILWQSDTTLMVELDSLIRTNYIKDVEIYTIKEKVGIWRFLSFILIGVVLLAGILIFLKFK